MAVDGDYCTVENRNWFGIILRLIAYHTCSDIWTSVYRAYQ